MIDIPDISVAEAPDAEEPITPPQGGWNMTNWMNAYMAAQAQNRTQVQGSQSKESQKEEPVSDMMGGWKFEGKDRPESPIICTRCQWARTNDQMSEPDKSSWCESCLAGEPGPGHDPDKGYRPPVVSASQDAAKLNQSFFG